MQLLQAVGARCAPLVRVPAGEEVWIKKALDTGADGVIVPGVNNAEQARRAVSAAKYPPLGRRSVGITPAHGYGADFAGYIDRANESTALVVQHRAATTARSSSSTRTRSACGGASR